jgi:DNA-binding MarR family transcriptional regulator
LAQLNQIFFTDHIIFENSQDKCLQETFFTEWGGRSMKQKKIFSVFFREKPAMMLLSLHNAKSEIYASSLAKEVDCTYSHVVKILQQMEKAGLVSFNKTGRLKLLTLTKKGSEIAESMDKVRNAL